MAGLGGRRKELHQLLGAANAVRPGNWHPDNNLWINAPADPGQEDTRDPWTPERLNVEVAAPLKSLGRATATVGTAAPPVPVADAGAGVVALE